MPKHTPCSPKVAKAFLVTAPNWNLVNGLPSKWQKRMPELNPACANIHLKPTLGNGPGSQMGPFQKHISGYNMQPQNTRNQHQDWLVIGYCVTQDTGHIFLYVFLLWRWGAKRIRKYKTEIRYQNRYSFKSLLSSFWNLVGITHKYKLHCLRISSQLSRN